MKHFTLLSFFMMFICVAPATLVDAGQKGQNPSANYLVEIGELELKRGNIDYAVHEFSKALLVEPGNKEALYYLNHLGYAKGLYEQPIVVRGTKPHVPSRMHIVQEHMARVEHERAYLEDQYQTVQDATYVCKDYMSSIDERAGVVTLCDGTKLLKKNSWHSGHTFIKDFFDGKRQRYHRPVQTYYDQHGSMKGSTGSGSMTHYKGSTTDFAGVYSDGMPVEPIYHPQMAHIDQATVDLSDRLIALEKRYDYENFLKEKYFNSQQQVANTEDLNELQHMQLVHLKEDLAVAHGDILRLMQDREDAYNRVVHEMDHLRLKGLYDVDQCVIYQDFGGGCH